MLVPHAWYVAIVELMMNTLSWAWRGLAGMRELCVDRTRENGAGKHAQQKQKPKDFLSVPVAQAPKTCRIIMMG